MIGRRGERGSGISVLAARHDDDDDFQGLYIQRSVDNLSIIDSLRQRYTRVYAEIRNRVKTISYNWF